MRAGGGEGCANALGATHAGYDTASVLREVGYGDDELRSLAERGIAVWHAHSPDTPG